MQISDINIYFYTWNSHINFFLSFLFPDNLGISWLCIALQTLCSCHDLPIPSFARPHARPAHPLRELAPLYQRNMEVRRNYGILQGHVPVPGARDAQHLSGIPNLWKSGGKFMRVNHVVGGGRSCACVKEQKCECWESISIVFEVDQLKNNIDVISIYAWYPLWESKVPVSVWRGGFTYPPSKLIYSVFHILSFIIGGYLSHCQTSWHRSWRWQHWKKPRSWEDIKVDWCFIRKWLLTCLKKQCIH